MKGGFRILDACSDRQTAVPFSGPRDPPKSILKTRMQTPPDGPTSLDREEAALMDSKQPEEEEVDEEEAPMRAIAATALLMVEDTDQERLIQKLKAAQKELASTKKDLENVRFYEKTLLQSRELMDANKRAETAEAELSKALLAYDRMQNKYKTLEGRLKSSDAQVEELRRGLAVVRDEKAKMGKLLEFKTAKETGEASIEVGK